MLSQPVAAEADPLAEKVARLEVTVLLLQSRLTALEQQLGAPAPTSPNYITQSHAAARLGLSKQRVAQLIRSGKLASIVLNGRRLIETESLRSFEESRG